MHSWSFETKKHLSTGEGGMVFTDDLEISKRCKSLRNLCFQEENRFVHNELGWNYRMTNIQAALGLAQLEKLDSTLKKKKINNLDFKKFHPSGSLGEKLKTVEDLSLIHI